MKPIQIFIFLLPAIFYLQINTSSNTILLPNKLVANNVLEVTIDTSEYEEEIIYRNRQEIAENVYNFQRRVTYNTKRVEVGRVKKKSTKKTSTNSKIRKSKTKPRRKLTKIEQSCSDKIEKLKDIYFDLNKFTIREDAKIQINRAILIMNKCPNLKFVASSFTDSRGSKWYNKQLSQRRANAVIKYINNNFNVSAKITGVGCGETKIKNHCRNGVKCTKKQHQVNRRTEIRLSTY